MSTNLTVVLEILQNATNLTVLSRAQDRLLRLSPCS
jgi:hypothetical protein